MSIRRSRPDEAKRLREVATDAKAYWGYDRDLVVAWAAHIDFAPAKEVYAAEADGSVLGWASLELRGEVGWLDDLWVDPAAIRAGVGTQLFRHVAERARALGASRVEWEAEPNALGFYERMGGKELRDSEPTEWGRILRIMGLELRP